MINNKVYCEHTYVPEMVDHIYKFDWSFTENLHKELLDDLFEYLASWVELQESLISKYYIKSFPHPKSKIYAKWTMRILNMMHTFFKSVSRRSKDHFRTKICKFLKEKKGKIIFIKQ
ncbi:hypothetical protein HZS_3223 [Henneguya salminicola]|nr:hypothetical protein HZS_3223 [Henneguya salminicola]